MNDRLTGVIAMWWIKLDDRDGTNDPIGQEPQGVSDPVSLLLALELQG